MKILNRKDFFKTPDNTVFCYCDKYQNLSEPAIKLSNCGECDFFVIPLNNIDHDNSDELYDRLDSMSKNSSISFPMDFECSGRDGMYDEDQMFAVFEDDDVRMLISRLSECLIK